MDELESVRAFRAEAPDPGTGGRGEQSGPDPEGAAENPAEQAAEGQRAPDDPADRGVHPAQQLRRGEERADHTNDGTGWVHGRARRPKVEVRLAATVLAAADRALRAPPGLPCSPPALTGDPSRPRRWPPART